MTEVDPFDDSIIRHAIKRHAFDPRTNHFRWIFESAYDDKKEFNKKLQEAFDDLADRQLRGVSYFEECLTSGQRDNYKGYCKRRSNVLS